MKQIKLGTKKHILREYDLLLKKKTGKYRDFFSFNEIVKMFQIFKKMTKCREKFCFCKKCGVIFNSRSESKKHIREEYMTISVLISKKWIKNKHSTLDLMYRKFSTLGLYEKDTNKWRILNFSNKKGCKKLYLNKSYKINT